MNLSKSRVFFILLVIVSVEAIVLLISTKDSGILGGDGLGYHNLALNLREFSNHVHSSEPTIFRAIGYPLFLSSLYNTIGDSVFVVRIAQFFLVLFSSYLLFFLAEKFTERDSAFYAAGFCATYLPFTLISLYHLTEILSIFLVILSMLLVVKIEESKGNKTAMLLGLVLGFLSLVRPSFLFLTGFVLIAVFTSNKTVLNKKLIISILIITGLTVCILPWTIRNKIVSGEFVPLATGKGISLYVSAEQYKGEIAYTIPLSDWDKIFEEYQRRYFESREEINAADLRQENENLNLPSNARIEFLQDKIYTADALHKFSSISLKEYLFSYPIRIVYLFSTADTSPQPIAKWVHPLAQIQFVVLGFLILIGLLVQKKWLFRQHLLWMVTVYIIVIHSVFHVEPRYSLPARPFLLIYAAIGFSFLISKLKIKLNANNL